MKIIEMYPLRETDGEVGIEVEVEGQNLGFVERSNTWNVVGDGSLRGESAEYILRQPVHRKDIHEALAELQELIRHATIRTSDRAGVHVHINCQQLTFMQVINFASLYLIFEDILIKFCGEAREGN